MIKESNNGNSAPESSHKCCRLCLGALTFHSQAVGDMVHLSRGCRRADRMGGTFKNGVVFSSRPVKVEEMIRLRVEKELFTWHGALRVGFTNMPPSARSLPLPCMAIPGLTEKPGHWAAPVLESYCQKGAELEFWVSKCGTVYVAGTNCSKHKLLTGVDTSKPLWAMIDIYGQTCSIFLLGSEKKGLFCNKRSCPPPETLILPDVDNLYGLISDIPSLYENTEERISSLDTEIPAGECCVCLREEASVKLPCGHQCLCNHCCPRVFQDFGTCPLCRHVIRAP